MNMNLDINCIFCKIIDGMIEAEVVYENDFVIAFKDLHPVAPVHVLLVPKIHIKNIGEINGGNAHYITEVFLAAKQVALLTNIDETGYRIVCNAGNDGGQVVPHLHFHIIGGRALGSKIIHEDTKTNI